MLFIGVQVKLDAHGTPWHENDKRIWADREVNYLVDVKWNVIREKGWGKRKREERGQREMDSVISELPKCLELNIQPLHCPKVGEIAKNLWGKWDILCGWLSSLGQNPFDSVHDTLPLKISEPLRVPRQIKGGFSKVSSPFMNWIDGNLNKN